MAAVIAAVCSAAVVCVPSVYEALALFRDGASRGGGGGRGGALSGKQVGYRLRCMAAVTAVAALAGGAGR